MSTQILVESEPAAPDATAAIQTAGFYADALLDQLADHIGEIASASADLCTEGLDPFLRSVRQKRISSLCDRGQDFIALAQEQIQTIERHNQAAIQQENMDYFAAERARGDAK